MQQDLQDEEVKDNKPVEGQEVVPIPAPLLVPEPSYHDASDQPPTAPSKKSHSRLINTLLVVFFVVANLVLLGGNATIYASRRLNSNKQASTSVPGAAQTKTESSQEAKKATPENVVTKHYVSEALQLEFDYPSNWRIASNATNSLVTISSAPSEVTDSKKVVNSAKTEITIYASYPNDDETVKDDAVVALASESLTYKKPSAIQRTSTNLTYVHQPSGSADAVAQAIVVTGAQKYVFGTQLKDKDYKKTTPFIVIKVYKCSQVCEANNDVPLSLPALGFSELPSVVSAKQIIATMRFNK